MKAGRDLNIKNVAEFYQSLKKEFATASEVVIDLSETKRIDASVAQVIHAAKRKASDMNKKLLILGVSPELKDLLFLAGLKPEI
ncbi:MAG TPA: STAS domain-containing protein [Spirochaetota bacterium]|nr:STAS domain-containing protein [Spirochaetota bacterium]HOK91671.1 STAS domain-containing protein [Spirochaetota bacterium]HPP96401.1 STAS domain-containing protein [Spirochaetota bacterium]